MQHQGHILSAPKHNTHATTALSKEASAAVKGKCTCSVYNYVNAVLDPFWIQFLFELQHTFYAQELIQTL